MRVSVYRRIDESTYPAIRYPRHSCRHALGREIIMKRVHSVRSVLAVALCLALTVVSGAGLAACSDMNSGSGSSSSASGSSGGSSSGGY
jgi:uncharacterized membrane protein YgcG